MLEEHRRTIVCLEVDVVGSNKAEKNVDLKDLVADLQRVLDSDPPQNSKMYEKGCRSVRLRALMESGSFYCFLFSVADVRVVDPSFEELASGNLRTERKKDGEGMGYSAHMIVQKVPTTEGKYSALLENVPGLPFTRLEGFISTRCSAVAKRSYKGSDGKRHQFHCRTIINALPSKTLIDALENGEIHGLRLIKSGFDVSGGMDELSKRVEPVEQSLRLSVKQPTRGKAALEVIRGVMKQFPDYTKMRVGYEGKDGPSESLEFDIDPEAEESDLNSMMFIKKRSLSYRSAKLPQASESIIPGFAEKMATLFGA